MADQLLSEKLRVPILSGFVETEKSIIEVLPDNSLLKRNINTVDGVNERGKTQIIKDVLNKIDNVQLIKEPPKFDIPGYVDTTWYDVLVKGSIPEFRKTIFEDNLNLVDEILLNSGVIENVNRDSIFYSDKMLNFWAFLFSRLSMKHDLIKIATENENDFVSDRNIMTSLGMNLKEYLDNSQYNQIVLDVLKIYSYLGRNNYIPVSKNTFVITSETGRTFHSGRDQQDIQDTERAIQEKGYRKILEKRKEPLLRELMSDFLGDIWHIEMAHIAPEVGWQASIDSKILEIMLSKSIKYDRLPDSTALVAPLEIWNDLDSSLLLTNAHQAIHVSGDFKLVWGDSELFIQAHPAFLNSERDSMQRHIHWLVSALPKPDLKRPESISNWIHNIILSLRNITETNTRPNQDEFRSFLQDLIKSYSGSGYYLERDMLIHIVDKLIEPGVNTNPVKVAFMANLKGDYKRADESITSLRLEGSNLLYAFNAKDKLSKTIDLVYKATHGIDDILIFNVNVNPTDTTNSISSVIRLKVAASKRNKLKQRLSNYSKVENFRIESCIPQLIEEGILLPVDINIYSLYMFADEYKLSQSTLDLTHPLIAKSISNSTFFTSFCNINSTTQ